MDNSPIALKSKFLLDPEITFLNHGSYGACPKPVFKVYQQYQKDLETHPVKFMQEDVYSLLEQSRESLSQYINCDKDDIIYVSNPTHAVGTIIHNISINPGDEILSTNLEYGSCDRMWTYDAEQKGYKYIQADITLPIEDKETFLNEFWSFANEQTKYIFISQITSSTGMILPASEIVIEAKKRGIKTIVDGAHVPAHIALDIKNWILIILREHCINGYVVPKEFLFFMLRKNIKKVSNLWLKVGVGARNMKNSNLQRNCIVLVGLSMFFNGKEQWI